MKHKVLGAGSFTTCFEHTEGTCLLKSIDPVKEAIAFYELSNYHVEPIKRRRDLESDGVHYWYEMRYFEPVESLKDSLLPNQWEFYQNLRAMRRHWSKH